MILTKDEAICVVLGLAGQPLTLEQLKAGLMIMNRHRIPMEFTAGIIEEVVKYGKG